MYRLAKIKALPLSAYPSLLACGVGVGLTTGLLVAVFDGLFKILTAFRQDYFPYVTVFLPLIGLVIVFLYRFFGKSAGAGLGLIFEVGQGREVKIPKAMPILAFVSTCLTHLAGASAGRTGAVMQMTGFIGQIFSPYFKQSDSQRMLIVTGIAAGFAALFQTPWAATVFACEVLILGQLQLFALVPAFVGAWTASLVTKNLGLVSFSFSLPEFGGLDWLSLLKLILLGLIFGLVGDVFAFLLTYLRTYFPTVLPNPYWRIVLLGTCLSLALICLDSGRYSGTGADLLWPAFTGKTLPYDWLFKAGLTLIAMSIGFQGGEVTPLFVIGASLGSSLAPLFDLPLPVVSALGYVAVFGSATNTFLFPVVLGLEIFGYQQWPLLLICTFVATRFNRHLSIYPFQLILDS